jgi:hypothetical protein
MTDDYKPDPEIIGPAMIAFTALHDGLEGDPKKILAQSAYQIREQIEKSGADRDGRLEVEAQWAIRDAHMLLGLVAEIFGHDLPNTDDQVRLAYKAKLVKRRRGKPSQGNKFEVSFEWWEPANEVEVLIREGKLQKVAVGIVAKKRGLTDRYVVECVTHRRAQKKRRLEEAILFFKTPPEMSQTILDTDNSTN